MSTASDPRSSKFGSTAPLTIGDANPTIQAALIDLDGTLVDSIPDLADAANGMRIEMGLAPLSLPTLTTFVGKGVDNLVRRALAGQLEAPEPDAEAFAVARAAFFRHYHAVNGSKTSIYPGVLEGLATMRAAGLKLAVVTNKPTEFTLPLLERMGLASYFDTVVCGDTCERKKPDPMPVRHACQQLGVVPGRAVTIGDSMNDAQAGQSAGTYVLIVPYGYNEGHDVRTLKVDGIVDSLCEAANWVIQAQTTQT